MAPTIENAAPPESPSAANMSLLAAVLSADSADQITDEGFFTSPWSSVAPSATPTFVAPNVTLPEYCSASPEDYDLIPSVLCPSLFVVGLVFALFGSRAARAFAFFSSALVFSLLSHTAAPYMLEQRALYTLPQTELVSSDFLPSSASLSTGSNIVATSLYGSALSLICADYFLERFALLHWFWNHVTVANSWSHSGPPLADSSAATLLHVCPGQGSDLGGGRSFRSKNFTRACGRQRGFFKHRNVLD